MAPLAPSPAKAGPHRQDGEEASTPARSHPGWAEAERLAVLERYLALGTGPEPAFDGIVQLAAELLEAPIAAISLIGADRHWLMAEAGLGQREWPLDHAFCLQALRQPGGLVVPDIAADARFAALPMPEGHCRPRFYAAALLETSGGLPLGTLCVLDGSPRPEGLTPRQRRVLGGLARQAMGELELRCLRAGQEAAALRHRQILDSATDLAIIGTDLEGRVTGWNAGAEALLGWRAAEMLGQTAHRFFTPEDRAARQPEEEMRLALEAGGSADERWHLRADGSTFWASGSMRVLRDEAGTATGFVKLLRDQTERHKAHEALQASNERYRLIARATADAVWDWDLARNRVEWTEALEATYGHRPDTVEPSHAWWLAQIHPDDRAGVERSLRAAIAQGESHWAREHRFRRADGSHATVLNRGFLLRDAEGRATRVLGAMLDLSGLRQAEAALRRSEDRLRLALAAARIGTFDYHVPDSRLSWDNRCRELFGVAPGQSVSYEETFLPCLHPEDREAAHAAVLRALDPNGTGGFSIEYRTIGHSDGVERWVAANGQAFFEGGVATRLTGTVLDIGARKLAEARQRELNARLEALVEARTRALRKSEEQLRQSQKMEAVGQLTGGIAHDFNNLLAGISGNLELLAARTAQGRYREVERYANAAQGAARRAAALTHRLLAFSRRQTLDPRPTDANRLVAGMEELVRRTVGPAITLEVVQAGGLWPTLVDPHQLENALLNLCINARDAMPGGGQLTIETANRWLDNRTAQEQDLPPGQYISLCVSDTGTGMTPEVVAKAFDPFFTTKPLGQGTGLGLSMVYGFARQSGGQVRIYSEPGDGTTVCLYLPRHLGEAEPPEPAPAVPEAPPARQGETVLVVDDEPTVRMLVTEVLEELGYAALEAADGPAGLRLLQSGARIDLLVTDVGLPGGMNGRQMVDAAREARPDLKVLFITGYAENAVVGNGRLEPGMHVMTKPFALEALAARITELIAAD
ncbi:PAS domain S-box protein [Pseudoroseomonas ludipueritiae]|uniref:histidine kinase n=1 Tax=Pseudoroseomonas ludipueritiae TaxID=198093 RepID=A0ABR7RDE8_9PROT|nr:PAS domain S-box protein [Pseudoroseomonas ludipueritiae]MBC9179714.1 PAS domain S-box protein [Pseudoroseomonas ludipueritiae]